MTLFWIAAFIVLTAAEALTVSLTCIWFAGGALAGLLVQVLGGSVKLQLALFAAVSFALLLLVRPLTAGILKPKETRTNTDGLIGRSVVVKETMSGEQEACPWPEKPGWPVRFMRTGSLRPV